MSRASGGSNMSHRIRSTILDFQREMSMKIAVENVTVCNKTRMGERL